jgi:hypothetical protein
MADQKPKVKSKTLAFKPAGLVIKKSYEEPIADLQTDITVIQDTEAETAVRPSMFGKTRKQEPPPSSKPQPPKLNTTRRNTQPKQIFQAKPKPFAEPVIKPAEPVIKPAEPVIKPAEPVIKPAELVIKPTEPVIKPAELVIKPTEPTEPIETETLLPPITIDEIEMPCKRDECPVQALPEAPLKQQTKKVDPELVMMQDEIEEQAQDDPYGISETDPVFDNGFRPLDRRGFTQFILKQYKQFNLPIKLGKSFNPDACNQVGKLETYNYQKFIREYMREASPYRGVLVYHGLGSGKTCTAIAASEALYNQSDKKIIVMTPKALKENFLDQLMFCGFRHYRLKNYWVSFDLNESATQLFAQNVLGVPATYLKTVMKRKDVKARVIWMPDLDRDESESNYDTLSGTEQTSIRDQIYATLNHKIEFIGYTGYTQENLMNKVNNPTSFDNAVIIIDEIHNITRLMAGKLDAYLKVPKMTKEKSKYEPVGIEKWVPKQEGGYDRAYLFYRLLIQASNSKIIALSGTPFVNKPVEIGILVNILKGYFKCVSDTITPKNDDELKLVKDILENHPRVNYYDIQPATEGKTLFFTILDEGYVKLFDEKGALTGVLYDENSATPATITELYSDIVKKIEEQISSSTILKKSPKFEAIPLMPPTTEEFDNAFVDVHNLKVKNPITFVKRVSGLISYYRGSKEELMPKVIKDVIVECPFSLLSLPQYQEARLKELQEEEVKMKADAKKAALAKSGKSAPDEDEDISYRFRSRSISNFAFPTEIDRPYPAKKSDIEKAVASDNLLLGDTVSDITEKDAAVVEQEEKEERLVKEKDEAIYSDLAPASQSVSAPLAPEIPYEERVKTALKYLSDNKNNLFKMDPNAKPEEQLQTYSTKFAEMYKRINESPGTSLVYSSFKTVEGLTIFGLALEANGFMHIQLTGPEKDRDLDKATRESFIKNPTQPRYIVYSGEEDVKDRQILINLFNGRINKLPPKIADLLRKSGLDKTENKKGEICRCFMITGAGAEGLSLRNVRTVHIMEPYWNKVRTDQVKGRAIRICSHKDLPYSSDPTLNQRTVEIYTYISVFGPNAEINETIKLKDNMKTTDQYILKLADDKEKIGSNFLSLMKAGAVDCQLNQAENEADIKCYGLDGQITDFLYDPRLDLDIAKTAEDIKITEEPKQKRQQENQEQAVAPPPPPKGKLITYGPPSKKLKYILIEDPKTKKTLVYYKSDQTTGSVNVSNIYGANPVGEVQDIAGKKNILFYK